MAVEKMKPNEKYCLSIVEASKYAAIGENRLRKIIDDDRTLDWVLHVGSQIRIKREAFEKWVSGATYI